MGVSSKRNYFESLRKVKFFELINKLIILTAIFANRKMPAKNISKFYFINLKKYGKLAKILVHLK